jgi:hypothetical protein
MYLVVAGWLAIVVALIGAAYSSSIPTLIVNQGLLYGVGYMLLDNPSLLILNTWFIERRGFAYGIVFAACDLWGLIWAFVAEAALDRFGLRVTLWIFAVTIFAVPGVCLFYIQERGATGMWKRSPLSLPVDRSPTPPGTADRASMTASAKRVYAKSPVFYLLTVANFLQAIGCEYPCLTAYITSWPIGLEAHLPPHSHDRPHPLADICHRPLRGSQLFLVHYSDSGPLELGADSGRSGLCRFDLSPSSSCDKADMSRKQGKLSDMFPRETIFLAGVTSAMSGITTITLWGLATSPAPLVSRILSFAPSDDASSSLH